MIANRSLMFTCCVFCIVVLLSFGCADPPKPAKKFDEKICDWQTRENLCLNYPESKEIDSVISITKLTAIALQVNQTIAQIVEEGDHWQTSCETQILKIGDCDDLAILFYSTIELHEQVASNDNKIMILYNAELDEHHMINVIYSESGSYIIDTTRSSGILIRELFSFFDEYPQFSLEKEFNLFMIY